MSIETETASDASCSLEIIEISIWNLCFALGLFSLNGVLSVYLTLGLNKKLAVAAIRCIVQVTLLGMLLRPVFKKPHWIWVLVFSVAMLLISSVEVMSRPSYSYSVVSSTLRLDL